MNDNKFENVQYFVNEEKRVVVCKIYDDAEGVVDDMAKYNMLPANMESYLNALTPSMFVGKAKCSAEDVFDVELGKRIAYKRAVAKMFQSKQKILRRIHSGSTEMFKKFEAAVKRCDERYERIAKHAEADCEELIAKATGDTK